MIRSLSLLATALVAPLSAQNIVVNDPMAGAYVESVGVSALYPGAGAPLMPFPHLFPFPPPAAAPLGGLSVDGATGLVWHSDGFGIAAEPHGAYPAYGAPPIPPFPVPPLLFAFPLTGLAIDSAAGILWLTDGVAVAGVAAIAGGPVVVPPFVPVAGVPPFGGLEWDPIAGTLWAVDGGGVAWNFFPGGAAAGPPIPPPIALPAPAAGIAIDKSGAAIGPMRSLYVLSAGIVVDYATGAVFPSFVGAVGTENGIWSSPEPSIFPAGAPCACPGLPYGLTPNGPMTIANPAWSVDVITAPGTFVIYAFDFFPFNPALPVINSVGCPFGLNFASAFGLGTIANAAGVASLPLPLTLAPIGAVFYMQHIMACPADPVLPVVITPLHQIAVSAP